MIDHYWHLFAKDLDCFLVFHFCFVFWWFSRKLCETVTTGGSSILSESALHDFERFFSLSRSTF